MNYLVETALLTHGLKSITNSMMYDMWDHDIENIAWISNGNIEIGTISSYLEFRKDIDSLIRIDCNSLNTALNNKLSGALTASGTMAVCDKYHIPVAVTCGMGGIGDIKNEELCPDLPALYQIPVILISTGPKDLLDRKQTIQWLIDHNINVIGTSRNYCSGYIFTGENIPLNGIYKETNKKEPPLLIINEIPEDKRISDLSILKEAIVAGKEAEKENRYYHPAANAKIDDLTNGYSSLLQLRSLLNNARFAKNNFK